MCTGRGAPRGEPGERVGDGGGGLLGEARLSFNVGVHVVETGLAFLACRLDPLAFGLEAFPRQDQTLQFGGGLRFRLA